MPTKTTPSALTPGLASTGNEEAGSRKEMRPPTPPPFLPLPSASPPLTEAHLSRLWHDQTFPPEALTTTEGERLRVIYRGRRGGAAGPDFRDAVISGPGGLLQGDVELHVRSGDFQRHGHDGDPNYARVVLHFVFEDDEGTPTLLPGGGAAPVVALAVWAKGRAAEIQRWLQRSALWREPCFSALHHYGVSNVAASLERLGDLRFRQKAAAFAVLLRGIAREDGRGRWDEGGMAWDGGLLPASSLLLPVGSQMGSVRAGAEELLWQALLEALGYGGEREALRLLARRLTWLRLRARLAPLAARDRCAEAARLLGAVAEPDPHRRGPARRMSGLRPANRPEKRLAGAAQLAVRFTGEGLLAQLAPLLEEEPARALKQLIVLFSVPGAIGRGRAVEVIANAVLPWLAALGPERRSRRAEALYRRLPLPARYGAVRHLHEALGGAVAIDFRRQQGMLYLLKQYCTRGGCGRCPLS